VIIRLRVVSSLFLYTVSKPEHSVQSNLKIKNDWFIVQPNTKNFRLTHDERTIFGFCVNTLYICRLRSDDDDQSIRFVRVYESATDDKSQHSAHSHHHGPPSVPLIFNSYRWVNVLYGYRGKSLFTRTTRYMKITDAASRIRRKTFEIYRTVVTNSGGIMFTNPGFLSNALGVTTQCNAHCHRVAFDKIFRIGRKIHRPNAAIHSTTFPSAFYTRRL